MREEVKTVRHNWAIDTSMYVEEFSRDSSLVSQTVEGYMAFDLHTFLLIRRPIRAATPLFRMLQRSTAQTLGGRL